MPASAKANPMPTPSRREFLNYAFGASIALALAGSCGGQLPTGRYLDFLGNGAPAFGSGMAHNKLFVTFLKLFGIQENTFGLPDFAGTVPGLVPELD